MRENDSPIEAGYAKGLWQTYAQVDPTPNYRNSIQENKPNKLLLLSLNPY